jgi:hypothetical protein
MKVWTKEFSSQQEKDQAHSRIEWNNFKILADSVSGDIIGYVQKDEAEKIAGILNAHYKREEEEFLKRTNKYEKIRTDIFEINSGDYIWNNLSQKIHRVSSDSWAGSMGLDAARELAANREVMRIPENFLFRDTYKYMTILVDTLACYQINPDMKDFHDWMDVWIPLPDKRRYTKLAISFLGGDNYSDRYFITTTHYRKEGGNEGSYMYRRLERPGEYKEYVDAMIHAYRKLSGRKNFLKEDDNE